MAWRQAQPYPVIAQALFGLSFGVFMFFAEKLFANPAHQAWIWVWAMVQVYLGIWLVRGRLKARRRILRCIRCGLELP